MELDAYGGWKGANPYYIIISTTDENIGIDLDESGWMATYAYAMRLPGQWILMHKASGHQALIVKVNEGDRPYYAARHIGVTGGGGSNEIIAYGIGKKTAAGVTENLWILPNGTVCGGEDVDSLGIIMVKGIGPAR